jgi:large subunit ribosomal protein L3
MDTIYAIKQNMTQVWDADAKRRPVTILKPEVMTVTQVKTVPVDGYEAIQVGFGTRRGKLATQPALAHLKKTSTDTVVRYLREISPDPDRPLKVGDLIQPETILQAGDHVAVTSTSKGRGFGGVVKRYGFKGGPRTHGQSDRERAPGAIGQGTSPGRIHKGKRMAGHYGVEQFTLKNLEVLKIDPQTHELWLSGPIPGSRGSVVLVRKIGKGQNAS